MTPDTPVDHLTVDSPPEQITAAIQQTARLLELQGVQYPLQRATSKAATRTGRFIPNPPPVEQPHPWAQQFQQLLLQAQAEDEAAEREAAGDSAA